MLTEELLRDYLERFMKHVEVDDEEYAKQGSWTSSRSAATSSLPNSTPMQPIYNVDHNY